MGGGGGRERAGGFGGGRFSLPIDCLGPFGRRFRAGWFSCSFSFSLGVVEGGDVALGEARCSWRGLDDDDANEPKVNLVCLNGRSPVRGAAFFFLVPSAGCLEDMALVMLGSRLWVLASVSEGMFK